MSRFLVTGCAGFIGSHLLEALLARGDQVVGVDSFTDYYERSLKEANLAAAARLGSFELIEQDLVDAPLWDLFQDADGVFHLAAQAGVRGSWGESFGVYVRDNVLATLRVFEAAAGRGIRVVWASSSSVYGDAESYPTEEGVEPQPISPYGVTKHACEHLARAYAASFGLESVGLRYFTVYGPRQRPDMAFQRIVAALASGDEFAVYGSGEQSRDVTYVGDAVSATLAAMAAETPARIYNVGGGSETSLLEVIRLAEGLTGRSLKRVHQPQMPGDVRRTAADIGLLGRDLGWAPRTPLAQGLAEQLAWGGLAPAGALTREGSV